MRNEHCLPIPVGKQMFGQICPYTHPPIKVNNIQIIQYSIKNTTINDQNFKGSHASDIFVFVIELKLYINTKQSPS